MVDDDDLKDKVREHLKRVLDKYWGSEKSADLKMDERINTWKALPVDVKLELFDAVLESWQHSRNTALVSEARNVEVTTQKINGLMAEVYKRWRDSQLAKERRIKKCTSALSCPMESRTNDPPAKSSSASAESGTAEPGPEGA